MSFEENGAGPVSCEVDGPDGKALDRRTATGAYASVSCQGAMSPVPVPSESRNQDGSEASAGQSPR